LTNQEKLTAEPLAGLGFGIVAYIDMLWTLILVFLLFSILLIPTLISFRDGSGYKAIGQRLSSYEVGTIGNMGYSSVQCTGMPLEIGSINLFCPFGAIGELYDYGVNLSDQTATNCANNDAIESCRPDSLQFTTAMDSAVGQSSYLYEFGTYTNLYLTPDTKAACSNPTNSRLFVQYTCVQTAESLQIKYN